MPPLAFWPLIKPKLISKNARASLLIKEIHVNFQQSLFTKHNQVNKNNFWHNSSVQYLLHSLDIIIQLKWALKLTLKWPLQLALNEYYGIILSSRTISQIV